MDAAAEVLFSKTRRAVLGLLFDQPGKSYYLRQLARLTGIGPSVLQHELNRLVHADLASRESDGNRVLYRANEAHPVYPELRQLVVKTCGVATRIADALRPHEDSITFAAIYGSVASGDTHARSDVDLLIVGDLSLADVVEAVSPLEEQLGREISVRLYPPDEYGIRRAGGDRFLARVMGRPMISLLGTPDDA